MNQTLSRSWQGLRSQWQASRVLRWGLVAIGVMLWSEGLARLDGLTARWQEAAAAARADLAGLQGQRREQHWPARAEEARRLLDAQQRLLWRGPSAGLTEAAFQDWLRGMAGKTGVNLVELQLTRAPALSGGVAASAPAVAGVTLIRAHLVGDLRRVPLLALLNEVGLHERALVLERLVLLTNPQRPLFELDLRAVAALPVDGKGP